MITVLDISAVKQALLSRCNAAGTYASRPKAWARDLTRSDAFTGLNKQGTWCFRPYQP